MRSVVFITAVWVIFYFGSARAEENNLGRIVVTPYRYEQSINKTATSVTVISQKDIRNSNAQKVIDLLRPVPGLVVRDWYGNASKASVDIRGFGEQGNLNVLVLLDGRRVNEVDLSGVSWSQIPIDQVERIEIIRGGSGSVLYGDNAVSGVINIITKTGKDAPGINLKAEYGSYDTNSQTASYGGRYKGLTYLLTAGRQGTNGYRNNSYYKALDFSSKLEYEVCEDLKLNFSSGFHRGYFGLPASLKQAVIDEFNRRYARKSDRANEKDYYFLLGAKKELGDWGYVDLDASYRVRDANSFFPTDGLYTLRSSINTLGINPKYTLEKDIFGHRNKFITGFDFYRSDYSANSYDATSNELKVYTDTNKFSFGGYLHNELAVLERLLLVAGYRYEGDKFEFDYHDLTGWNPDIDKNIRPNRKAFNGGLIYEYGRNSNVFFDISQSFRFPEVDEFTYNDANWQQQLNTALKPQSSFNYELGVRHSFCDNLKADLSLFRMHVKNELYYNSTGGPSGFGQNENYDKTIHEGIEFNFNSGWKKISLYGNYTFTNAYFKAGSFSGNEIPLVPHHKGSLGLMAKLPKGFILNIIWNYVGKRYFLNDQANNFSRLNGYSSTDLNIGYTFKDLTFVFGINNLFNNKYSQYAGVDHADNDLKFYYPSPERNFNLRLDYSF